MDFLSQFMKDRIFTCAGNGRNGAFDCLIYVIVQEEKI